MGFWDNSAYVASPDLEAIEEALRVTGAEEGRSPIVPIPREPERCDPMQYGRGPAVARWGLALVPGAPGWTVLKTAPLELLVDHHPRPLTRLAQRLGCYAFQHNVYDSSAAVLIEATALGDEAVSGFCSSDPTRFYGRMPEAHEVKVGFRLFQPDWLAVLARQSPVVQSPTTSAQQVVLALCGLSPPQVDAETQSRALATVFGRPGLVTDNGFSLPLLLGNQRPTEAAIRVLYLE